MNATDPNERNGAVTGYSSNALNQYTSRINPGILEISGKAVAGSTVSVGLKRAARNGEWFFWPEPVDNTAGPVLGSVEVVGVLNDADAEGRDAVAEEIRTGLVPADVEDFPHDLDGNLLEDSLWEYTWDGENRLTSMKSKLSVPASERLWLAFGYDWQSRRVWTDRRTWDSTNGQWEAAAVRTEYVYDGWNLIATVGPTQTPTMRFVWGLDLSDGFEGAGGVGGLVTVDNVTENQRYAPGYDGNGNVVLLADWADGAQVATYEYGPFGELLAATGPAADANPFRFSTKFKDETGLLYYGYRYYNPETGRWLNRDPIGENGGVNLHAAVGNNLISRIDFLGLKDPPFTTFKEAWRSAAKTIWGKPNVATREYGAAIWAWCADSLCNSIKGYSIGDITEGPRRLSMQEQLAAELQGKPATMSVEIDYTRPEGVTCALAGTIHSHPYSAPSDEKFSDGDISTYDQLQNKYNLKRRMVHYVIHHPTGGVYEYTAPIQGKDNKPGTDWEDIKNDPERFKDVGNMNDETPFR